MIGVRSSATRAWPWPSQLAALGLESLAGDASPINILFRVTSPLGTVMVGVGVGVGTDCLVLGGRGYAVPGMAQPRPPARG